MSDPTIRAILVDLNEMMSSSGWKHLKRDFSHRIQFLQDEINTVGGNEMKYSEGDLKKIEFKLLNEILNYPDRFITEMQLGARQEQQDPYLDQSDFEEDEFEE